MTYLLAWQGLFSRELLQWGFPWDFTTDEPGRRSSQLPAVSLHVRLIHASLGTGHILQPGPSE